MRNWNLKVEVQEENKADTKKYYFGWKRNKRKYKSSAEDHLNMYRAAWYGKNLVSETPNTTMRKMLLLNQKKIIYQFQF